MTQPQASDDDHVLFSRTRSCFRPSRRLFENTDSTKTLRLFKFARDSHGPPCVNHWQTSESEPPPRPTPAASDDNQVVFHPSPAARAVCHCDGSTRPESLPVAAQVRHIHWYTRDDTSLVLPARAVCSESEGPLTIISFRFNSKFSVSSTEQGILHLFRRLRRPGVPPGVTVTTDSESDLHADTLRLGSPAALPPACSFAAARPPLRRRAAAATATTQASSERSPGD
jgi:hypothetical protein